MRTQGAALDRVDTQALAPAVYCTGRRPDAAGGWARAYEGGTSAQRRGLLLLLGSCDVAPGPMQLLGWCASTAPPASAARPSRPPGSPAACRDERRGGPVPGPSRPRSVSVLGGSRRRRGLDHGGLADSEGSPGPAPVCGPPGGPNHPIMGPGRSGNPSAAGNSSPETHGARHPTHPHIRRDTRTSQFKRLEDLHEDRRVPDVHIISCCFRLAMSCLQKENCLVDASLNGGRQPPFAR